MTALDLAAPAAPRAPRIGAARILGLSLLGALGICALAGPALIGADPAKQSLMETLQGPSAAHPLGTDNLGRDMAARLLSGAQLSLSLALLSVLTAALLDQQEAARIAEEQSAAMAEAAAENAAAEEAEEGAPVEADETAEA